MKKVVVGCLLAVGLFGAACSQKTLNTSLAGEWDIVSVNGKTVDAAMVEEAPYIGFNYAENKAYGTAGCNRFFAGFALDSVASTLSFDHAGATRMMCANMEVEDQILAAMNEIVSYKVLKNGDVELLDAKGASLMQLSKR